MGHRLGGTSLQCSSQADCFVTLFTGHRRDGRIERVRDTLAHVSCRVTMISTSVNAGIYRLDDHQIDNDYAQVTGESAGLLRNPKRKRRTAGIRRATLQVKIITPRVYSSSPT